MTTFNPLTDLPTGDRAPTSLEEMFIWVALAMRDLNTTETRVLERGKLPVNTFVVNDGNDADSKLIISGYAVLEYDTSKIGLSIAPWKKVKSKNTAEIPSSYK